jgi:hypothetical protein
MNDFITMLRWELEKQGYRTLTQLSLTLRSFGHEVAENSCPEHARIRKVTLECLVRERGRSKV